jgi:hypothetical protein
LCPKAKATSKEEDTLLPTIIPTGLRQLISSQYASGSGGSAVFDVSAGVDFSENGITYDYNGNIKTLARKGLILNSSPVIDQLTYSYYSYEDRPYKVSDAGVNTAANKLGDFRDATNPADDYNYNNGNGSLTTDFNKGINSIEYWRTAELPKIITTSGACL